MAQKNTSCIYCGYKMKKKGNGNFRRAVNKWIKGEISYDEIKKAYDKEQQSESINLLSHKLHLNNAR